MTGAQALVETLAAEGVELIFGLPGVHAMPIYDALYQHPRIRHIGVRHEQAGAYMADGYARSTGRIGVCLATTGPGAANTVSAMAEAYSSSSPVLQVCTQVSSSTLDRGKGVLHEAKDQLGMFRAVVGWNKRVESPQDIASSVHQALARMRSGRSRPVQIEIPADFLSAETGAGVGPPHSSGEPVLDSGAVEQAAQQLRTSQAPIIWAGGGVIASGATGELLRLAEFLQAPVITTFSGRGAIPEDHPLSLGNWATSGEGRELLQGLLDGADLALAAGTRFSAASTGEWSLRLPERLIHVDIDPSEVGKNYPASLAVIGDAKAVLAELLERLRGSGVGEKTPRVEEITALRESIREMVAAYQGNRLQVLDRLRSALRRDAIVVCDMTMVAYAACRHFRVYQPRTFLYPSGFGILGFGFPAALGAKAAWPERQVVAICGDGGFIMGCQELATAVQEGLNLVVLVFNDGGYGVLRMTQDFQYSGRRIAVDLHTPDFSRLAEAFGARGVKVDQFDKLGPALTEALDAGRPAVIEVVGPLMESLSH
jgi:acetolactate synthase-1/2/3 large subunit